MSVRSKKQRRARRRMARHIVSTAYQYFGQVMRLDVPKPPDGWTISPNVWEELKSKIPVTRAEVSPLTGLLATSGVPIHVDARVPDDIAVVVELGEMRIVRLASCGELTGGPRCSTRASNGSMTSKRDVRRWQRDA